MSSGNWVLKFAEASVVKRMCQEKAEQLEAPGKGC